jgi:hypothetical protein
MICGTIVDTAARPTRTRGCHSAQEWIELRRQTQAAIDHIQNARSQESQRPEDDPE